MGNSPVDRQIAALAARQLTRKQLLALGLTPAEIDHRVKLGRLIVVHRGVYAVGHPRTEPLARLKAATLAGGPAAVISFSSAAFLWGLTKRLATPLELTVKTDRRIDARQSGTPAPSNSAPRPTRRLPAPAQRHRCHY